MTLTATGSDSGNSRPPGLRHLTGSSRRWLACKHASRESTSNAPAVPAPIAIFGPRVPDPYIGVFFGNLSTVRRRDVESGYSRRGRFRKRIVDKLLVNFHSS